jgi:hypothetical protein
VIGWRWFVLFFWVTNFYWQPFFVAYMRHDSL